MTDYLTQIMAFIATHTAISSAEKAALITLGDRIEESIEGNAKIQRAISTEKKRRVQETQSLDADLRRAAFDKMLKQRNEIQSAHKEKMDTLEKEDLNLRFIVIPRLGVDIERQTKNGEPIKQIKLTETLLSRAEARRAAIKTSKETAEAADNHDAGEFHNIIGFWAADAKREKDKFDEKIKRLRKRLELMVSHIIRHEVCIEMMMARHTRRRSV